MTTATKTREQELADQIAAVRAKLADFDKAEEKALSAAAAADAQVDELAQSFSGPTDGLDQVRTLRAAADEHRAEAAFVRRRATALAEASHLAELESELAIIRTERESKVRREAALARAKALREEAETRSQQLYDCVVGRALLIGRLKAISQDLNFLIRQEQVGGGDIEMLIRDTVASADYALVELERDPAARSAALPPLPKAR